jgi:hypothetical protein
MLLQVLQKMIELLSSTPDRRSASREIGFR